MSDNVPKYSFPDDASVQPWANGKLSCNYEKEKLRNYFFLRTALLIFYLFLPSLTTLEQSFFKIRSRVKCV